MPATPALFRRNPHRVFVETGSYTGDSIALALEVGFPEVRSVELSDELFAHCKDRFAGDARVKLWHGSSPAMLPEMLADLNEPVTFWLDAHHCVSDHVSGEFGTTPILEELAVIAACRKQRDTILIDDMRCCGERWKHISRRDIEHAVLSINPRYVLQYEGGHLGGEDILVAKVADRGPDMYGKILPQIAESVTGIVHFGAHLGQEAELYERCGIKRVAWVEPNPDVLPRLREKVEPLGHLVIPVAVADFVGEDIAFHITNNGGQSSSLFPLGTHTDWYPSVRVTDTIRVPARTIQAIINQHNLGDCNLWHLDIQGAEHAALSSAGASLAFADFVYSEVQFEYIYKWTRLIGDIDALLPDFTCRTIMDTGCGWGEAFYERIRQTGAGLLERVRHGIRA